MEEIETRRSDVIEAFMIAANVVAVGESADFQVLQRSKPLGRDRRNAEMLLDVSLRTDIRFPSSALYDHMKSETPQSRSGLSGTDRSDFRNTAKSALNDRL